MSDLRNRTFAPPPPRHPTARPPSPDSRARSSALNAPPPPNYPSPPQLPPRPPPSPRPDVGSDYPSLKPIPSQAASSLDVPYTPAIQRLPPPVAPNRPGSPRSFSENAVGSMPSADVNPTRAPTPPPELPPPVSRAGSFNSITDSPPPVHHAKTTGSATDSANEDTLSEKELRDLYHDEEIDRFLRLFSAVGRSSLYRQSSTHRLHST